MKKLLNGIVDFRKNVRPNYRETFARLALGQAPDSLFIACSDSRVVPNLFASTDPGDLFVIRNVGNIIPACDKKGVSVGDESEAAAIEFGILNLNVQNVIVCGHSECGAMLAIHNGLENVNSPNLKSWLTHGEKSMDTQLTNEALAPQLEPHNKLSQLNVLTQLEHLKTYPVVKQRIQAGTLQIHGWWFDIKNADVYSFDTQLNRFVLIDEKQAAKIISKL